MTAVTIFDFEASSVRTVEIDGAPWFVGRDVCRAIELGNESQALARLDGDERMDGVCITDPIGRQQRPILISEPGVYRLVFTSRTEVAERFKRWLAHEVLPALRRTGRYEIARDTPVPMTSLDVAELRQMMMTLREVRLTFGMRAARTVAARMPLPDELIAASRETVPTAGGDSIGAFLAAHMIHTQGARTMAADAFEAYLDWCHRTGHTAQSATAFGRRMTALGIGRIKASGRMAYVGIDIADDADDDTAAPADTAPDTDG